MVCNEVEIASSSSTSGGNLEIARKAKWRLDATARKFRGYGHVMVTWMVVDMVDASRLHLTASITHSRIISRALDVLVVPCPP